MNLSEYLSEISIDSSQVLLFVIYTVTTLYLFRKLTGLLELAAILTGLYLCMNSEQLSVVNTLVFDVKEFISSQDIISKFQRFI